MKIKKSGTNRALVVIVIVLAFTGIVFGGGLSKAAKNKQVAPQAAIQVRPPDDKELAALERGTMTLFAEAVKNNNFDAFYSAISTEWKKKTDAKTIAAAFADFNDKKIDLDYIKTSEPALNESPIIDQKGILKLAGHYPSKKTDLLFELQYQYEADEWKLVSLSAQIK